MQISRQLAQATLRPMVLAILRDGPGYGYRIIKRIHSLSDGEIEWTTGTLYPFLHSLENEGVLRSYWEKADEGPKRKYYCLTPIGEKALETETAQWERVYGLLTQLFAPPLSPALGSQGLIPG